MRDLIEREIEDILNMETNQTFSKDDVMRLFGVMDALKAENDAFKSDIKSGRLVRFKEGEPYWYCPHCREEVGAYRVTYGELHDVCGRPVEWIQPVKRIAPEGIQI